MKTDLQDLFAFLAVVKAGGFREGARASDTSASRLSESVRRLETRLGVRLLNRTTRSVLPTEAGARLAERLVPALGEVEHRTFPGFHREGPTIHEQDRLALAPVDVAQPNAVAR